MDDRGGRQGGDEPAPVSLGPQTRIEHGEDAAIYTATLGDAWSFATPSGGVLMTVAMRAITAEVGDPVQLEDPEVTLDTGPAESAEYRRRLAMPRSAIS